MEYIVPIRLKLSEKLADPDYFNKFFDERTRDELAAQLRELRDLRGLSQIKFAAESGMKQSAVSRIEQAEYSGWTYKTLLRAAQTLKARLKIDLIPAEKVIEEYRKREAEQFAAELEAAATENALASSSQEVVRSLARTPDAIQEVMVNSARQTKTGGQNLLKPLREQRSSTQA